MTFSLVTAKNTFLINSYIKLQPTLLLQGRDTVAGLADDGPDEHLQLGVAADPGCGDGRAHGEVEEAAGEEGAVEPQQPDHHHPRQLGAVLRHQRDEARGDARQVAEKELKEFIKNIVEEVLLEKQGKVYGMFDV